jgi:histidine triad (HIT) family protein
VAYDPNNIFAKILRGEIPAVTVYEDDKTLAFMDVMPQAQGHVLIIPKEPAENLLDLSPEGAAAMMVTTQRVAKAVKKALDAPGIYLMQLNGAPAGQTVFHVHCHVIPRDISVALKPHAGGMVDAKVLEAVAVRIRGAM